MGRRRWFSGRRPDVATPGCHPRERAPRGRGLSWSASPPPLIGVTALARRADRHGVIPTAETTRSRRFALPDLKDPRTDEAIDALLSGAERHRGRPAARQAMPFDGSRPFEGLEPRIAWTQALARENARHLRYGRSASIVVFEARPLSEVAAMDGWMERVAGPIAHTIKRDARATDLITRSADARFQVLLPETTEAEAVHFADRVISDCGVWLGAIRAPIGVRAAASATHGDLTLEDALIRAIEALARD